MTEVAVDTKRSPARVSVAGPMRSSTRSSTPASRHAERPSVAVPYVLRSHSAHAVVDGHLRSLSPRLTAHSLAESYSVLTRLPGDARLAPPDAARLLSARFGATVPLDDLVAGSLPTVLAPVGIAGGAVYDALVALAARGAGLPLATRDRRAAATYAALGATVDLVVG